MSHPAVPITGVEQPPPEHDAQIIEFPTPPAPKTICKCGNGTPRGHGEGVMPRPFTCDEVLAIRARVEVHRRPGWWPW